MLIRFDDYSALSFVYAVCVGCFLWPCIYFVFIYYLPVAVFISPQIFSPLLLSSILSRCSFYLIYVIIT